MGRAWRKWRGITQLTAPSIVTETPLRDHIVVAGFGCTGRAVASALREAGIPLLVVESSYALTSDVTDNGFLSLWGDISRKRFCMRHNLHDAKMMLLTMPDQNTVNSAVDRARRMSPKIIIVARSTNVRYLENLRNLGVTVAVQPEFEGGLEMVRQGLLHCGRNEEDTTHILERIRHEIYRTSEQVAALALGNARPTPVNDTPAFPC